MVNLGQLILILYVLIGILLSRILPMTGQGWVKWYYRRKGISYFVVHILNNNSVGSTKLVKENKPEFTYKKGKYVCWVKDQDGRQYYPYINYRGERVLFFNQNNINPMVFKSNSIEPGYNNPEIFANMIENHEISETLNPKDPQLQSLKRIVVMGSIITIVCIIIVLFVFNSGVLNG